MKNLIIVILLFVGNNSYPQSDVLIAYDNIENFNWEGEWKLSSSTTGDYPNISVSPTTSTMLYGGGNNAYEMDWYSLPNIPIDQNKSHYFRMRLAAQNLTNFSWGGGPPPGMDAQDHVIVQLSVDGGITYVDEMRISGKSNAIWDYNLNGVAWKMADGNLTTFAPSQGGDRTNLGDGYSLIELWIPSGESEIAIDIFTRANRMGEDWWMDNFELYEVNEALPVELSSFEGTPLPEFNLLEWVTQSEYNSDYFLLEKSLDGTDWEEITTTPSAGNSTSEIKYSHQDFELKGVSYYRLKQVDIDGQYEMYGPIAVIREEGLKVIKYTNLLGQEINPLNVKGIIIETYEDGSIRKVFRP
jgi:hypothetical protein